MKPMRSASTSMPMAVARSAAAEWVANQDNRLDAALEGASFGSPGGRPAALHRQQRPRRRRRRHAPAQPGPLPPRRPQARPGPAHRPRALRPHRRAWTRRPGNPVTGPFTTPLLDDPPGPFDAPGAALDNDPVPPTSARAPHHTGVLTRTESSPTSSVGGTSLALRRSSRLIGAVVGHTACQRCGRNGWGTLHPTALVHENIRVLGVQRSTEHFGVWASALPTLVFLATSAQALATSDGHTNTDLPAAKPRENPITNC